MKRYRKKYNGRMTPEYLQVRKEILTRLNYPIPKWILFIEYFLSKDYVVHLYEAKRTYSKYITLYKNSKNFLVRISNHKPIYNREVSGDCDFFVGVTNLGTTTTRDAAIAALKHFGEYNFKNE